MPLDTKYEDQRRYAAPTSDFHNPEDKSWADAAFEEGYKDREQGTAYDECPYKSDLNKTYWQLGWEEKDKELSL